MHWRQKIPWIGAASLIFLFLGSACYFASVDCDPDHPRRLAKSCFPYAIHPGWLPLLIIGVIYMFAALSLVCDEFFVPALEAIADSWELTHDVAGATLMAAGGSAPELFTSFIGTFKESDVGFGTIVGSAVFNVLFVIGCCAIFANETLELSWWPLARDCCFYTIGLLLLATFFGGISPMFIEWWEAVLLFAFYFGYVVLMKYNAQLQMIFDKDAAENYKEPNPDSGHKPPLAFRAGLLNMLTGKFKSFEDEISGRVIVQVSGNLTETFNQIDKNKNGVIDFEEMVELVKILGLDVQDNQMRDLFENVRGETSSRETGEGQISFDQFSKWYVKSEERVMIEMQKLFKNFDTNKNDTLDKEEVRKLLVASGVDPIGFDESFDEAFKRKKEIGFDLFKDWYIQTDFFAQQKSKAKAVGEAADGVDNLLEWPADGGILSKSMYIFTFPLVVSLVYTLRDVRIPANIQWKYATFVGSILWIGVYSFFMVEWATYIGDTLGIPTVVMGLTFLAAGTSVPDLLSSVIVAKQGHGDMAVSSSIGSNIFDILVGLPLPWLSFAIIMNRPVEVFAESLIISILVLIGMLVLVVATVHFSGWRMTKTLGYMMFLFYVIFVVQDLIRAKWDC